MSVLAYIALGLSAFFLIASCIRAVSNQTDCAKISVGWAAVAALFFLVTK